MLVKRGILCYPLSAVLVLLLMILQNPTSETVQDDLRSIGELIGFLGGLADEGFDVQRLLNACTKLHDVAACAACAAGEAQPGEYPESLSTPSTRTVLLAQLNVSITAWSVRYVS